jgi:hypothetical protein
MMVRRDDGLIGFEDGVLMIQLFKPLQPLQLLQPLEPFKSLAIFPALPHHLNSSKGE